MKEIELTRGKVAVVSDEDYEYLNQWKWMALNNGSGNFYAARNTEAGYIDGKRKRKTILMHREVAKRAKIDLSYFIDHVDRDSLNNQRSNLRSATNKQNIENSSIHKNNTSGYPGVYLDKRRNKWVACIRHNYKRMYLGEFINKQDAIEAKKEAEKKYFTHAEVCACG